MSFRWMRGVALVLGLAPAAASAFETVDELPWPSANRFPAYVGDPVAPWGLFAYAGLMYDSNAFRRDSNERSDFVARYGVGARAEQLIAGRQRVAVEGFGEYYDYNELSEIDHFGYGLRGEWMWEIGNQLSGSVLYARRRRHADLGDFQVERRAMVTSEQYLVDGGYRFHPSWRLFGALEHSRSRRDVDETADLDTNTARGSLLYRTPLGNELGVEVRGSRGEARFPTDVAGVLVTNDFDEREVAAVFSYGLGATLRASGRIGHTERDYDNVEGRNFSGTTYRGVIDWLPTGKLVFGLDFYHYPQSVSDIDVSHVVRTGSSFRAAYAATFKLVFTARFVNEHRVAEGSPEAVLLGTPVPDETLRFWRFGVGWEPQRHWQLGAGLDYGERRSNILGRDYDYHQVMLNARFSF